MERRTKTAPEGFLLTNGFIYVKKVDLGDWDSPENWDYISVADYEQMLKEQSEAMP